MRIRSCVSENFTEFNSEMDGLELCFLFLHYIVPSIVTPVQHGLLDSNSLLFLNYLLLNFIKFCIFFSIFNFNFFLKILKYDSNYST